MKTFTCVILLSFTLSIGAPALTPPPQPVPIVLAVEWHSGRARRRRNHYRRGTIREP